MHDAIIKNLKFTQNESQRRYYNVYIVYIGVTSGKAYLENCKFWNNYYETNPIQFPFVIGHSQHISIKNLEF